LLLCSTKILNFYPLCSILSNDFHTEVNKKISQTINRASVYKKNNPHYTSSIMEFLTFLGFIAGIISFYSLFIQPFIVYSLISRINHLEENLRRSPLRTIEPEVQKPQTVPSSTVPFLNTIKPVETVIQPQEHHIEIPAPQKPAFQQSQISTPHIIPTQPSFDPIKWLKEDFFVKLGGIFVLLAGSWFVSFLFANDYIGPSGRVSLGVLGGCILLGIGYWQMIKRPAPAFTLVATGVSIIIVSLWSGRIIFDLYSSETTFGGMILALAVTAIIAIIHKKQSPAVSTLFGAYLIPFLTGSESKSTTSLFIYLLIVTISMFIISFFRQWRSLVTISILAISSFSILFYIDKTLPIWYFIIAFGSLFYLTSLFNAYRSKTLHSLDIVNSFLATFVTNIWIISFIDKDLQVASLVISSIITFAVAFFFSQKQVMGQFTLIQLVSSTITLFLALYIQFQSQPLVLTLSITSILVGVQWLFSIIFRSTLPFKILPWFHILSLGFFEQWLFQDLVFNREYLTQMGTNPELAYITIRQPLVIQSVIAMTILGFLLFLNAWIIKRYVKNSDSLQSLVKSLLFCGGILYGYSIIIQLFEIFVQRTTNFDFTQTNDTILNVYPQLMMMIFMAISWFTATTHLNKDTFLRWFGWILLCISTLYQFVFLSSTIQPYSFIYIGILFLVSLAITHLSKQASRGEITLYSIGLTVISFFMQFTASTTNGDTYKALFYLLYIPTFLILILHPFFQKTKAEQFLSIFYKIGMAFLLFALVFFELWSLGIIIRIIIFVTIGLLFIATGFFKQK
jgi:Predicted membrane protein (DUF2339)